MGNHRNRFLEELYESPMVIIYRGVQAEDCLQMTKALAEAGIRHFEVTMNSPGAIDAIRLLAELAGDGVRIGAGTVLTAEQVREVSEAGGQFIISPNTNEEVIRTTKRLGLHSIPGAFTPTEIIHARECGADIVKVFPVNVVGPEYIKQLRGPLQDIPLMATGGVRLDMVEELFLSGVNAIGLGVHLLGDEFVASKDWRGLRRQAEKFLAAAGARGRRIS
ncbi:bifunctional 4-hydroxy-2-oxoglutarate aldolase/2-dehydro-3-deoxy-phosphogluconate aldolase [Paenibacillus arenilitoris]|uniref:Bifunctional 4-hydroxy-2-oxoglutarate aldolase/2-dehydro-3-deoxy-phosphogluconate aldolase n=1 Tax=Paenibacillus arenilitoris TaxID=2772299 RepID=A0A927CS70_9BACL|nr:bifunctional 4-hydroxy-2-oxoglutarate aldolase/2-dehydro-3-deoxy-phosphogluconate aldolase [Paenibacillus arenilitoris]MBD2870941.1 bifunctional 4-hydroxy-2-oxoglutarate aldolase/2-dehydro-3-deoxy-phosphogluconate aldolase [Paenibacillus arenilitoris]